jgi:hypothetical protein
MAEQTSHQIEDSFGRVVANPDSLDHAYRLFWVGFNSHRIVAVAPDGTRTTIAEKGRGA